MFHNVLMTSLTPLRNTDEISCWQNRPFTTIWPEDLPSSTSNPIAQRSVIQPKSPEVRKTIKKRTKRIRTAYSTDQLKVLERTFIRLKYISAEKRRELSESLKITEKSIKVWFQNRRMKEKRDSECSDSSTDREVSTTQLSPPPPVPSVSPAQDVYICPKEESNQFRNSLDSSDPSNYQLPDFHYCNYPDYQNVATSMLNPGQFTGDRSAYPTYYYPTYQDYYYGDNYVYDGGNTGSLETQWSASNFDLNYFQ